MDERPTPRIDLQRSPWPDVPERPTLLIPVGSTEQHGPHLPFDVDTRIAVAVAHLLADRLGPGVVVAPPVAFGSSGEHQAFPGTLSIGTEALTGVIVELGRSARTWAQRLVFVNGHGGNLDALTPAVDLLRHEGSDAHWVPCSLGAEHAGIAETGILLHLDADRVRTDEIAVGQTAPLTEILPRLREEGVRPLSANGILGDPRGATAAAGAALLEKMAEDAAERLARADS